jgi:hypothetical protein
MDFLDHALNIHKRVFVVAVGMVRPYWQNGARHTKSRNTKK